MRSTLSQERTHDGENEGRLERASERQSLIVGVARRDVLEWLAQKFRAELFIRVVVRASTTGADNELTLANSTMRALGSATLTLVFSSRTGMMSGDVV